MVGLDDTSVTEQETLAAKRTWVELWMAEVAIVAALGTLVFFVHDVGYVLSQPYWTDEAWVVASTRYPISDLPGVTAATPIGWSALLRVFSIGGQQAQRIEPLAFAALAIAAGYWLARQLGWSRRWLAVGASVLCAATVLTVPAMVIRNDLKQYTADAFVALAVLALTSRLDRSWSRRELVILCAALPVGMLFSHATVFVGAMALLAVVLVQLARRAWDRLREAAIAAAVTGAAMLGVYELFDARAVTPTLTAYWRNNYVPVGDGLGASVTMIRKTFDQAHRAIGLGPVWVVLVLFAAGLVTMAYLGRFMVMVTVLLLVPEMLALSALQKYPLFDVRTSTFLLVVMAVTATIGVCGVCALVARRSVTAAGLLAAAAVATSLGQTNTFFDGHTIPLEDVRTQAADLATQRAPGDVVVVNYTSNWGFAYYWTVDPPSKKHTNTLGYQVIYPPQKRILIADGRTRPEIVSILNQALTLSRTSPGSRIWLVRTHIGPTEAEIWAGALRRDGLTASIVDDAGLAVIDPNRR